MFSAAHEAMRAMLDKLITTGLIDPFEQGGQMESLDILSDDKFRGTVDRIGFIGGKLAIVLSECHRFISPGRWAPSRKKILKFSLDEFSRLDFLDQREQCLAGPSPGCHIRIWNEPQETGRRMRRSSELRLVPRKM